MGVLLHRGCRDIPCGGEIAGRARSGARRLGAGTNADGPAQPCRSAPLRRLRACSRVDMAWRLDKARGRGLVAAQAGVGEGRGEHLPPADARARPKLLDGLRGPSPCGSARARTTTTARTTTPTARARASRRRSRASACARRSRAVSSHLPNEEVSIDWLRAARASKPGAGAGGAPERGVAAARRVGGGGGGGRGGRARRLVGAAVHGAHRAAGRRARAGGATRAAAIRDYRPVVYDFSWLYASARPSCRRS